MTTRSLASKVRQSVLQKALKDLDWDSFGAHLKTVRLDEEGVTDLLGHIRRSADFLIKRPHQNREKRRLAFVERLEDHLAQEVGPDTAAQLRELFALIQRIEAGYREILQTQEATQAAQLLPETQAAAALARASQGYHELTNAIDSSIRGRQELTLQTLRIKDSDGSSYSPDAAMGHIVESAAMTLMLLGYRHDWFTAGNFLELPKLPDATADETHRARATELLAASWRHWKRTEERCRYFGGDLKVFDSDELPSWAPEGAQTAIEYTHISQNELFDYLANERLDDWQIQNFHQMVLKTSIEAREADIAAPLDLPPSGFVSAQEAHANVCLSEMLGYDIVNDREQPCGLRLLEWVRGYATLQCLARERYAKDSRNGPCFTVSREALIAILDRVGLKSGAAEKFIDQASLRASSRDLFDQPLVRIQDGSLLLFGPGVLTADPARVTLSAIGNQGEQLGRKGKAFEQAMLRFLQEHNFQAKSFKFKDDGEEYEYDAIVPWDDHVFVLECKNRTLSGNNPVAAYRFTMEIASATRQVKRLATALVQHAELVLERTGIAVTGKTIVPCVVNSLTYALQGQWDGVYVTDASSLKRFFHERYFHLSRHHHLKGGKATVLHRSAVKALWKGERPTPTDLLAYLGDPLQLQLMTGHAKRTEYGFCLGERTVVAVADLGLDEMSTASIAKLFSADQKQLKRQAKVVTRAIGAAQRKHEWQSVKKAERAWRTQQQRKPSK